MNKERARQLGEEFGEGCGEFMYTGCFRVVVTFFLAIAAIHFVIKYW